MQIYTSFYFDSVYTLYCSEIEHPYRHKLEAKKRGRFRKIELDTFMTAEGHVYDISPSNWREFPSGSDIR